MMAVLTHTWQFKAELRTHHPQGRCYGILTVTTRLPAAFVSVGRRPRAPVTRASCSYTFTLYYRHNYNRYNRMRQVLQA